jgi:hypothetical protein
MDRQLTFAYRELYFKCGVRKIIQRALSFRKYLANTRSNLSYLRLIFRVGLFNQEMQNAVQSNPIREYDLPLKN